VTRKLGPIVIGMVALIGAVVLLAANEWQAGRGDQAVAALLREITDLGPAPHQPQAGPVRVVGQAKGSVLRDPLLLVETEGCGSTGRSRCISGARSSRVPATIAASGTRPSGPVGSSTAPVS
jgi:hypothetical protein